MHLKVCVGIFIGSFFFSPIWGIGTSFIIFALGVIAYFSLSNNKPPKSSQSNISEPPPLPVDQKKIIANRKTVSTTSSPPTLTPQIEAPQRKSFSASKSRTLRKRNIPLTWLEASQPTTVGNFKIPGTCYIASANKDPEEPSAIIVDAAISAPLLPHTYFHLLIGRHTKIYSLTKRLHT